MASLPLEAAPAFETGTIACWEARIGELVTGWQRSLSPVVTRERLRTRAGVLASRWADEDFLLLAFGSVARAEPARDLDLLIVTSEAGVARTYRRLRSAGIGVDLNIAPPEWLRSAWRDPEWGYWVCEGYVLHAASDDLEAAWRQSVNRYWGHAARRERTRGHRRFADALMAGAVKALLGGATRCAALLQHEAIRACGIALIQLYGTRAYSHRSFIGELQHACRRAGIPARSEAALVASLGPASTERDRGAAAYFGVRTALSSILRSSQACQRCGYSPALSRDERGSKLMAACLTDASLFEAELERVGIPLRAYSSDTNVVLAEIWRTLDPPESAMPHARRRKEAVAFRPTCSTEAGIRWRAMEGRRLKLIVDSGGCRTPTCAFCDLPAFATRGHKAGIAAVVESALDRDRPDELALYNDGSLLNPDEVGPDDLHAACQAVARHGIDRLWIESVPRFVTRTRLDAILRASRVRSLVVAMGFQSAGNAFSMGFLGRPDADALFERAIDIVHDAGALVRLYLLWGFGSLAPSRWAGQLARSIAWAHRRNVDIITVCPYLPNSATSASPPPLCHLWSVLAASSREARLKISLSLPAQASCGQADSALACEKCRQHLGAGTWSSASLPLDCRTRSSTSTPR